jgi:hypothetical protein
MTCRRNACSVSEPGRFCHQGQTLRVDELLAVQLLNATAGARERFREGSWSVAVVVRPDRSSDVLEQVLTTTSTCLVASTQKDLPSALAPSSSTLRVV